LSQLSFSIRRPRPGTPFPSQSGDSVSATKRRKDCKTIALEKKLPRTRCSWSSMTIRHFAVGSGGKRSFHPRSVQLIDSILRRLARRAVRGSAARSTFLGPHPGETFLASDRDLPRPLEPDSQAPYNASLTTGTWISRDYDFPSAERSFERAAWKSGGHGGNPLQGAGKTC
jgi:hypothetical protein